MTTKQKSGWAPYFKAVIAHAVSRAALFLAILVINPFGIAELGDRHGREVWQQLYADCYGASTNCDKTKVSAAREAITVVGLDRPSLSASARDGVQPDSMDLLKIFRALNNDLDGSVRHRPKAIFIDLLLEDFAPPGTQQELLVPPGDCSESGSKQPASPFRCMLAGIAQITRYKDWEPGCATGNPIKRLDCIQRAGGTPVLIAEPVDPRSPKAANPSSAMQALGTVAIPVPTIVDESDYPLVNPDASKRQNRLFSVYPAALLYAAWTAGCDAKKAPNCPVLAPDPLKVQKTGERWQGDFRWSPKFDSPVEVVWGVGRADSFTNQADSIASGTFEEGCRAADTSAQSRLVGFARVLFSGLRVEDRPPCLYSHSFTYDLLLRPRADAAFRDRAFAGKIVMIGMTQDSSDYVDAGPHKRLPGVFYHAMALDNLLQDGAGYAKPAHPVVGFLSLTNQDLSNTFAAFGMVFFGGLVITAHRRRSEASRGPFNLPMGLWIALALIASLLAMVLLLYLLTGQVKLIPDRANFAALSIVLVLELFKIASEFLGPILHKSSLVRRFVQFWWADEAESDQGLRPGGHKSRSSAPTGKRKTGPKGGKDVNHIANAAGLAGSRSDGVPDITPDPV